jgi:uncharacterized membrane protein YccC
VAGLSAFALVVAVLACCAAWISTAWPEGAIAAMMAAVYSSFYATQDDPGPALLAFMGWTIVSLPIAALYLFAILPAIDGFPMLVLALAPVFLVLGYMQADPRQVSKAMPLILGVAAALSLQETFNADFPDFMNGNLAQIAGIGAAVTATRLFRTFGAAWSVRRILRRGWEDLAALAERHRPADRASWTSAMLDRLGLITPRLALAAPGEVPEEEADALNDLRIGLNLIDVRQVRAELPPPSVDALDRVLDGIARTFRRRTAGAPEPAEPALLASLDRARAELAHAPQGSARDRGFAALTGLRRNLFPAAAAATPA